MKLRLTAKGFEHYSGQMGVIMFEDGLSVGDVLEIDAVRVAGVIGAEWEDGSAANVSQRYLNGMTTTPPQTNTTTQAKVVEGKKSEGPSENVNLHDSVTDTYSKDQLAKIADTKGIVGLREIASTLGIKGNSINGLIEAILAVAGAPEVAIEDTDKAE